MTHPEPLQMKGKSHQNKFNVYRRGERGSSKGYSLSLYFDAEEREHVAQKSPIGFQLG